MSRELLLRRDPAIASALRRDLDRYAREAPEYDADRGLERLTASLALAAGAAATTSVAPATGMKALVAKALAGSAAKALVVCVAIGAAGAVVAVHGSREERAPAMSAPATRGDGVRSQPAPVVVVPAAALPVVPAPQVSLPVASRPSVALEPRHVSRAAPPPAPPVAPAAAPASRDEGPARLREEMESLARLRRLASSDPAAALGLAAECDRRYGAGGVFGEEREAIRIDALTRAGRTDEARARGRDFLALYPSSPFASRIRAVLAR